MNPLKKNPLPSPLLIPLLFWVGGIIVSSLFGSPGETILFVLLALGTATAFFVKGSIRIALIILLIFIGGWLRMELSHREPSPLGKVLSTRESIMQSVDFEVRDQISTTYGSYSVRILRIGNVPLREKALLYSTGKLSLGTRYRSLAQITPLDNDPLLDIFPRSYVAKVFPRNIPKPIPHAVKRMSVPRIRAYLMANLDRNLGDFSGFAKALLLSDISSKNEHRTPMTRGGMIHLIVVSGLHVWFIYGVCIVLLYMFLPKKFSELISLGLILLFAALNGWAPPILRSTLMIAVLIVSRWTERPVGVAQVLSISLFIITGIDPAQLYSPSLLLSFACVTVIMFGVPTFGLGVGEENRGVWYRYARRALDLIIMNILVSICILPVSMFFFGTGTMNGIVGNLVGVPLTSAIMPLAFILMLVPKGFVLLAPLRLAYDFLVSIFYAWMNFSGSLPFFLEGSYISGWEAIAGLILVVLLLLTIRGKWRALRYLSMPCGLAVMILVLVPLLNRNGETAIYVFGSGVSDVSLIRLDKGMDIMIDTGQVSGSYAESGEADETKMLESSWLHRHLLGWLARKGIRDIDWLVLTHMHSDHIGGLASLIRTLKVKNILCSDESVRSQTMMYLRRRGYLSGIAIHPVTDTLSLFLGGARLKVLHPDAEYHVEKENNRSLVLRLDYGDQRYLFTGDIEKPAEEYLVEKYPLELDSDYLKVPHHGSRGSSSPEFIEAVSPHTAWFTTNRRNRYRFPHTETLQRYRDAGVKQKLTGDGTIVVPLRPSRH